MKKLYRSRENSMLAGVCGGLGNYLQIDPSIVRIVFVMLAFYNLLGLLTYIVLAVLIPLAPGGYEERVRVYSTDGNNQTVKVIGGGMILLGLLAIVSYLDIRLFSWMQLENLWPAVIILLGVLLLVRGFASEE